MATNPSSCAERKILIHPNGQTTAYIQDNYTDPWKPAETILIQHGFARTADHFYHWVPALARRYNVIRRDLRGHGYSSYPGSTQDYDYSTATILEEIKDTLDQLHLQRVHFLGESTSGMLAEAFAATYPDRVSSVIVCSSPTHLPLAAQQFLAFGVESWPEACRRGSRDWAEKLAASPGTIASADPGYIKWWIDQVAVSDGEGLAGYAEFLGRLDSRPYLSKIQAPMLILAPSSSALVSVQSMEDLLAQVKTAKVQLIQSQGHEIYLEPESQRAVLQFLDELKAKEDSRSGQS
ncbi:hypothetical protein AK830_g6431 [Neonectria ditissima]|uniref:AB hydrolase-1 domain-containing protein n=1 Tax=Neonectria ditissima TaxID=78410 RepID=A0A0P7B0I3_9HYPO|nr:hypothetical protein AK830_g6431 [Neonectria ditissima]